MAQPNEIALIVDPLNNGTTETQTYSNQSRAEGSSLYRLVGSDLKNRDELRFAATLPKRSGNFPGVLRTEVRLTQSVEVEGVETSTTVSGTATLSLQASIPLGMTEADVKLLRQRMIALLDEDSVVSDLMQIGEV
jgi:hypothetical protein